MKILLGVPEYPPYHIGGGGEVFKNLAQNYKKMGHDVVVMFGYYPTSSGSENITEYTDESGIKFYQIPEIPYPKSIPFLRTVMPPNFRAWLHLKNIIKKEKPDMAHLHGYGHFFIDTLARILKKENIKFIFTNHGYPKIPYTKNKIIIFIWNTYKKLRGEYLNKYSYKITCVSDFVKSEYTDFRNKLIVIPNGLDTTYHEYSQTEILNLKNSLSLTQSKILLSVGRITGYKGFQQVISILRETDKNIKYVIIGSDQDYKKILENLIIENNLQARVVFTGPVNQDLINLYYQMSDVIIIPSLVESFGLVGLEALKNKRPVISSGIQGLSYLKESRNVYEYNNNDTLFELINTKISYVNEEFINRFDWYKITELYIDVIKMSKHKL